LAPFFRNMSMFLPILSEITSLFPSLLEHFSMGFMRCQVISAKALTTHPLWEQLFKHTVKIYPSTPYLWLQT
ncbi:MAG: hypothetical protein IJI74_03665, partial [Firmicutes bacterium]|nr:hypothetical protein [Bacillota bacterium]